MTFPRASARRLFVSLAALAASFLFASPARALLGDVNCDGVVNATDAQVLANFLVGISTSVPCPQNADVNGDGQVNVADVLLILQLSKGLRTSFSYQSTSVLAVTPSSGTANILLGAEISAIFSNPVSSASLPGNFTVADAVSGQISTGTFRCSQNGTISVFTPGVPFLPAHNYVVSLSTGITDNFGNPISTSVVVSFQTAPLGTMNLTSVNNSTATMNTLLSSPISVQLFTSTGAPAVQVSVVFVAQMGNGTFQPSGLRQVTVLTDNNGNAAMAYKTGTQAMLNTVSVSAVGFSTVPVFQVQTAPTTPVNLRVYTGVNQSGAAGSIAPLPLVVQATDTGGDYIQGTTVTFTVPSGQGSFAGQISSSVVTNSTGTAAVMFTFGPSSGTVSVSAGFPGMLGMAPSFTLYDMIPAASTSTFVSGNVLDSNTLLPLTSVYVYLTDNPSIWERTDQNGNFLLPASTGPHVVEVDGFESGLLGGNLYPAVSFPVNVVQGRTTGLGIPAMLPELDQESYLDVSSVQGGTLTIRSQPLWQLYVAPGQVTFQDGSHTGRLYASFVSHSRIPMPVAGGKTSRFDDTIQPPTVVFNPPAQVTFPNADSLPPGTVTEIYTLDYVSGAFKKTGAGLVSADGMTVTSLPGQGITQGGWHLAPNPTPPPPGCVGGTLGPGNGCSSVYVSAYGQSAQCTPAGNGNWQCLLCNLPTNQGTISPAVSCGLAPGSPPPLGGPGSGLNGNGNSPPPVNQSPNGPPTPAPGTTATITVMQDFTALSAGTHATLTAHVTLSDGSSASGLPVTFQDSPTGYLRFTSADLGQAQVITDMSGNAQVYAFIASGVAVVDAPVVIGVAVSVLFLNAIYTASQGLTLTLRPCQPPSNISITPVNAIRNTNSVTDYHATFQFVPGNAPNCPVNVNWSLDSTSIGGIASVGPQDAVLFAGSTPGAGNVIARDTLSGRNTSTSIKIVNGSIDCQLLPISSPSNCAYDCKDPVTGDVTYQFFPLAPNSIAYQQLPGEPPSCKQVITLP